MPASRTLPRTYVVISTALAVMAMVLYLWTVWRIRRFQPEYPSMVMFSMFTPPTLLHIVHSVFPIVCLLTTGVSAAVAVRIARLERRARTFEVGVFAGHCVIMAVFIAFF